MSQFFRERRRNGRLWQAALKRGVLLVSISQTTNLQEATKRLDAAVDALEDLLKQKLSDDDDSETVASLQEKVRRLTDERDHLLQEVEALQARVRRLESVNDEISGRITSLMTSLEDNIPALSR